MLISTSDFVLIIFSFCYLLANTKPVVLPVVKHKIISVFKQLNTTQ
jgi:hypothetical protein